jgi:hypothetical protein
MRQPKSSRGPTILLLGDTHHGGQHRVVLAGKPLWLPRRLFEVFCGLVHARLADEPYAPAKRLKMQISRLRRTIDEALGKGTGDRLIVLIGKGRYALDVPAERIQIDPTFREHPFPAPLTTIRDKICELV